MPEMYKIYISSTYSDLKEVRSNAKEIILNLNHHPIAMENYKSTSEKPLDKCIKDIRSCDIFVGIYAFRYGYIPKGFNKSITHLEYEEACKWNKICLLFVIGEEKPTIAVQYIDPDRNRIDELRELILESHTVTIVDDLTKFGENLSASIQKATPTPDHGATPSIPSILPYLSDRSEQATELETALDECEDILHEKPLICLIHGNEIECHDKFIKRLHEVILPETLDGSGKMPVDLTTVEWPSVQANLKVRYKKLTNNINNKLTGNRRAKIEEIREKLNKQLSAQMIYFTLPVAAWEENEDELIKKWFQYWNNFPNLNVGKKLMVFLCIKYKDIPDKNVDWAKNFANRNDLAREFALNIDYDDYANIYGLTMEELNSIEWSDVDKWIETHTEVYCDDSELRTKIKIFYENQNNRAVPMLELATKLNDLMLLTQRREGFIR